MPNNDENAPKERIKKTNASEKHVQKTIFSQKEVIDTVKGFVLGYIRGDITLSFRDAEEILNVAKLKKQKMNFTEAREE